MSTFVDVVNGECFESTTSVVVLASKDRGGGKHNRNVDAQKLYKCTQCPKTYKNATCYRKHLLQHGSKENLHNCQQYSRTGSTDTGLRMQKKMVHADKLMIERTLNNNELLAIDDFKIFENSKEPTYLNYDFMQAENPPSPLCSDDCSNMSIASTLSTTSNSSNFNEANAFLYDQASNSIFSTTSDSSRASDFIPVLYEEIREVDEEILLILKSEMEKNFVDVVLSFSEY